MKRGMTAVQIVRGGKTAAVLVGRDRVEELWSIDGIWAPITKAIARGEGIGYFARPSGYSKDQPRSIVLKDAATIKKLKDQIEALELREIPLDPDDRKAWTGVVLVKELPKKQKPVKGPSVGSENKEKKRKHPSGLEFYTVKEIEIALRSHNANVRAAKRPAWAVATHPMLLRVYKRAVQTSNAGADEKGREVTRHKKAMKRLDAFLKLLFHGEPSNPKYTADVDCLPESHPWRRTIEARRDITGS